MKLSIRSATIALVVSAFGLAGRAEAQPARPPTTWVPAAPDNYAVTGGRAISRIIVHKSEGHDAAQWFANPAAGVSAHYSVLSDGTIHQSVPDQDIAYHAGNWDYNVTSIGIEHDGYAALVDTTEAEYRASAQLTAYLCFAYGIPIDRAHLIGHNEVPDPDHPGEFGGVDHHTCPGPYWDWTHYMQLVKDFAGQSTGALQAPPGSAIGLVATADGGGYWFCKNDGGVFSYGNAGFHGCAAELGNLNAAIVGMAATPDDGGYWQVGADGGVFSWGNAGFHGSLGSLRLNAPIVGIAATPSGNGYWLVAADGGVFALGDAGFSGSLGSVHLNAPIVGIAATPSGNGYWLVAADGGIFCFGDAGFHGSLGSTQLNAPIVGMAITGDGQGYWLAGADGGVFCFGDAPYDGSMGSSHLNAPVSAIAAAKNGPGYRMVGWDGGIFTFGGASFAGAGP